MVMVRVRVKVRDMVMVMVMVTAMVLVMVLVKVTKFWSRSRFLTCGQNFGQTAKSCCGDIDPQQFSCSSMV